MRKAAPRNRTPYTLARLLAAFVLAAGSLGAAPRPHLLTVGARPAMLAARAHAAPLSPNAVLTVTKTADTADGICDLSDCSLREAIIAANNAAGADSIIVPAGVYTLTIAGRDEDLAATGDLDIADDLTLAGDGATLTRIDANQLDRIFHLLPNVNGFITGVTVQHGETDTSGDEVSDVEGGGLFSAGTLTVTDSVIAQNFSGVGGGVSGGEDNVYLALVDTQVLSNTAGAGGGVYANGGELFIADSVIAYNQYNDEGGGLLAQAATTLLRTSIAHNTTTSPAYSFGGGLLLGGGAGTLVESSQVYSNTAWAGAGLATAGSQIVISATTLTGNVANSTGGGLYNLGEVTLNHSEVLTNSAVIGGGLYNAYRLTVDASTIAHNLATEEAGGIASSGQLILSNSLIAYNQAVTQAGGIYSERHGVGGLVTPSLIQNSTILSNSAAVGGGLYLRHVIVDNTLVTGNTAQFGGGLVGAEPLTLTNSTILSNTATQDGGGLHLINAGQLISGTTIAGNTATQNGGGVYAQGEVFVVSSTVTTNRAGSFGGGLYNLAWTSVQGGEFSGNQAEVGGGLYNNRLLAITGTVFSGNQAEFLGGGLATVHTVLPGHDPDPVWYVATVDTATFAANSAMDGGGVFAAGTLSVTASTFITNSAAQNGGGLFRAQASPHTVHISATTFLSNTALEGGGLHNLNGSLTLHASDVISNFAGAGGGLFNGDNLSAPGSGTPVITVFASRLEGNASYAGGALANGPGATALVSASNVVSNTSPVAGALWNRGNLAVDTTTIAYNQASLGGAGLVNTGTFTLTNSLLAFNVSGGDGGGLWTEAGGGPSLLQATQVLSNSAIAGGGLFVHSGELRVDQSTLAGNVASTLGAGIFNQGQLTITDSDLLRNAAQATGGGLFNGYQPHTTGVLTPTVVISGSRVSDNSALTSFGGGLHNDNASLLTVLASEITSNTANVAGGVSNWGTLVLEDTRVTHNQAAYGVGGIGSSGPMLIARARIAYNSAVAYAGGVYAGGPTGTSVIQDGTIVSNSAPLGGGLYTDYAGQIVHGTAIISNTASVSGGGIYANGPLTLTNSTLSGNTADEAGGGLYQANLASIASRLNNVTIANNIADADDNGSGDAGGVYVAGGTLELSNSILAANADLGGQAPDCAGTLGAVSYNLIQDTASCTLPGTTTGLLTGLPALLGPLADNGGETFTHALLSGSPAINAGNPALPASDTTACAATDQRGEARPQGARCDLGAYETDGPPVIAWSGAAYTAGEQLATVTLTATLSAASAVTVTVGYSTTDGTATGGLDYTPLTGTLTFAPGQLTATLALSLTTDSLDEANETLLIALLDPQGASLGTPATATVTIEDGNDPPQVRFAQAAYTATESAVTSPITADLSVASGLTITVHYATGSGSATTADYTPVSGTLTFAPGTTTAVFNVPLTPDDLDENNEMVALALSNPAAATLGSPNPAALTIVDDDTAPSAAFTSAAYTATETAASAVFTVSLSAASGLTVTVAYATSGGSATPGSDYLSATGTLTFTPGTSALTATVPLVNDSLFEAPETLSLALSAPANATLGSPATALLTLFSEDLSRVFLPFIRRG